MPKKIFLVIIFVLINPIVTLAQDLLGTFEDWHAFKLSDNEMIICVMTSTPLDMEPKNVRRGDVIIQITHNKGDKSKDVVNIIAGYTFDDGSNVFASVDTKEFEMFTKDDAAWNATAEQDNEMVRAMISGSHLTVKGLSSRGTNTIDIYSLLGFTAAYRAINDACND